MLTPYESAKHDLQLFNGQNNEASFARKSLTSMKKKEPHIYEEQ
jgi:hypothetical protein